MSSQLDYRKAHTRAPYRSELIKRGHRSIEGHYCGECKKRHRMSGILLELPKDPLHRRWVCKFCIISGFSDIVKWHISEGNIDVLEMRQLNRRELKEKESVIVV